MDHFGAEEYYDLLMRVAMKDGIVTDHEQKMIKSIMSRIEKYQELLDKALDDGLITLDEKTVLYTLRTKTFQENLQFVYEDKILSDDEKKLLNTLNRILSELGELENKYTSTE